MRRRYQYGDDPLYQYPNYDTPATPGGGLLSFNQIAPTYFGRPMEELNAMIGGLSSINEKLIDQYDKIDFALSSTEVMPEDASLLNSAKIGLKQDIDNIASSPDYTTAIAKVKQSIKRNYLNNYDLQKASADKIKYNEFLKSAEEAYQKGYKNAVQYQDLISKPYESVLSRKDENGIVHDLDTSLGVKYFDIDKYLGDLITKYQPDTFENITQQDVYYDENGNIRQPTPEEKSLGLRNAVYQISKSKIDYTGDLLGGEGTEGLNEFLETSLRNNPDAMAYFEDMARIASKTSDIPISGEAMLKAHLQTTNWEEALSASSVKQQMINDDKEAEFTRHEELQKRDYIRKAQLKAIETGKLSRGLGFDLPTIESAKIEGNDLKNSYVSKKETYEDTYDNLKTKLRGIIGSNGGTDEEIQYYSLPHNIEKFKLDPSIKLKNGVDIKPELLPFLADYEMSKKAYQEAEGFVTDILNNIKLPDKKIMLKTNKNTGETTIDLNYDPLIPVAYEKNTYDYEISKVSQKPNLNLSTEDKLILYRNEVGEYLKNQNITDYPMDVQLNSIYVGTPESMGVAKGMIGTLVSTLQNTTPEAAYRSVIDVQTGESILESGGINSAKNIMNKIYSAFSDMNEIDPTQIYAYIDKDGDPAIAFRPVQKIKENESGFVTEPYSSDTKEGKFYAVKVNGAMAGLLTESGYFNSGDLVQLKKIRAILNDPITAQRHATGKSSEPIYVSAFIDGQWQVIEAGSMRFKPSNGAFMEFKSKDGKTSTYVYKESEAVSALNEIQQRTFELYGIPNN